MDAHQCIPLSLLLLVQALSFVSPVTGNSKLFREYIGAEGKGVNFSNVPIHPDIDFHFILSFAVDYTSPTSPTNGNFQVQWDQKNLSPASVSSIKTQHGNVKVAMSLGGDTIGGKHVKFTVKSISSWVKNAITSLTKIVEEYHIDGIDIDYEHFSTDPNTFAECVGRLVSYLKENKIISFASIAPFDDGSVQPYYLALWKKYGHLIDYVDFQFYAYEKGMTIGQFMQYFEKQRDNYKGGKLLVSIGTDGSGGLTPQAGFFKACERLKRRGMLEGIFIWSADDSKKAGFPFETQSQKLLAS